MFRVTKWAPTASDAYDLSTAIQGSSSIQHQTPAVAAATPLRAHNNSNIICVAALSGIG